MFKSGATLGLQNVAYFMQSCATFCRRMQVASFGLST
jgi:hypothetical protein